MTDDMFPDEPIDAHQQIECLKREIDLRNKCYPKWVANGRMRQEQADYEIKAMNAALRTLHQVDNMFMLVHQLPDRNWRTVCRPIFDDPFTAGMLIVDAIRILALAYRNQEGASSSKEYLTRIKQGMDAEWEKFTTDVTGNVTGEN